CKLVNFITFKLEAAYCFCCFVLTNRAQQHYKLWENMKQILRLNCFLDLARRMFHSVSHLQWICKLLVFEQLFA
ncbi:hypothetical protein E2I00_014473, partial [Balaenoptera physalus]